jgi:hypothetical protein
MDRAGEARTECRKFVISTIPKWGISRERLELILIATGQRRDEVAGASGESRNDPTCTRHVPHEGDDTVTIGHRLARAVRAQINDTDGATNL